MIDARSEELINAGIDGELDADGRAALDELLAGSDEARDYHASLQRLDGRLKSLPEQDLPPGLHEEMIAAIDLPAAPVAKPTPRPAAWPAALRYGLAASLGLVAAVAVYETQPGRDGQGYDQFTGTIAPAGTRQRLDELTIEDGDLSARATLSAGASSTVLEFAFDSDRALDIRIDYGSTGLEFDGLARSAGRIDQFSVANNVIRARGAGEQRFAVVLNRAAEPRDDSDPNIRIEVARNGDVVARRALQWR